MIIIHNLKVVGPSDVQQVSKLLLDLGLLVNNFWVGLLAMIL